MFTRFQDVNVVVANAAEVVTSAPITLTCSMRGSDEER